MSIRRTRHTGRARGATRPDRLAKLADLHNGRWSCADQLELFGDTETASQEQATAPGTPSGQQ